ncbi:pyridoxamine 5'-phosphate oxidase family protein [Geodermatophilus nigrescens]|uniref:pyridoxamine 5'-phosphate oxidase family protein n=1 Tax=Geodermatophilus sp. FMUSA9-8 TaxID=3120155 RepID=UPI003008136F
MGTTGLVRRELGEEECRALLAGTSRGHLAFTRSAMPAISPVRFVLDGGRVVIPTRPDSDHVPPAGGAVVVLGVDGTDGPDGQPDWAVTVVGPVRTVHGAADLAACDALGWPVAPVPGDGHGYVVLTVGMVSGWRTEPADAAVRRRSA